MNPVAKQSRLAPTQPHANHPRAAEGQAKSTRAEVLSLGICAEQRAMPLSVLIRSRSLNTVIILVVGGVFLCTQLADFDAGTSQH